MLGDAMIEGADTISLNGSLHNSLHGELAIEDELPFVWRIAAAKNTYAESNARILQVCLALDDQAPIDKVEDQSQGNELARLDLKVNLLLDLVGRLLLQNQSRPVSTRVRFNSRGASWKSADVGNTSNTMQSVAPKLNERGVFEVYLHNCLIDPLRLPGRIESVDADRVQVEFDRSAEQVVNLIDKLTFRRHRRRVADTRNPQST